LRPVDQLYVGHRRVVAGAEAALEDAQVTARTTGIARAERGEQVAHRFLVAQAREGQATVGDAVGLGQRDQRLGDATQFLRLRQGGLDEFVLEQRSGHVGEHGVAVGTGAVELAAGLLVAHGRDSLSGVNAGTLDFSVAILALVLGLRWPWPASLAGRAADSSPSALSTPSPFQGEGWVGWGSRGSAAPSRPPLEREENAITRACRGRIRPPAASSRA